MVKNKSKVFVTGHKGLVGSAVVRKLTDRGYKNIITVTKDKLDLRNQKEVFNFFQKKKNWCSYQCRRSGGGNFCKQ